MSTFFKSITQKAFHFIAQPPVFNYNKRMKIIYSGAQAEITEKKSRFIAEAAFVSSEEEAAAFIGGIKKKYWDCRHNCSAYLIGENGRLSRCNDDGEPSGTAGRPILDAITGAGLTNACVVVSRYFGGILLGTGGLVRAYGAAAKKAIDACTTAELLTGVELTCCLGYDYLGKLQYMIAEEGLNIISSDYLDNVRVSVMVPLETVDLIKNKITELSAGKAVISAKDPVKYIACNGKVILI